MIVAVSVLHCIDFSLECFHIVNCVGLSRAGLGYAA